MEKTKYDRKIDSTGRLLIPVKLREKLGIEPNMDVTFYTHLENGKMFLCIECPEFSSKIAEARALLDSLSVE